MPSIVDQAKSIRRGHVQTQTCTRVECELAIAWMRGEVGITQACVALRRRGLSAQNTPGVLYRALRVGIRTGMIRIEMSKNRGRSK